MKGKKARTACRKAHLEHNQFKMYNHKRGIVHKASSAQNSAVFTCL